MSSELPEALQQAIDGINAADTEKFVSAFAADGLIDDWGRVLKGHDGVRSWAGSDAIGAKAQITVTSAETQGHVTEIRFDWRSNVFTGASSAFVTVHDGKITEFRIPPA